MAEIAGVDLMDDIRLDVQEAREAPTAHPQWEFEVILFYYFISNFYQSARVALTKITGFLGNFPQIIPYCVSECEPKLLQKGNISAQILDIISLRMRVAMRRVRRLLRRVNMPPTTITKTNQTEGRSRLFSDKFFDEIHVSRDCTTLYFYVSKAYKGCNSDFV